MNGLISRRLAAIVLAIAAALAVPGGAGAGAVLDRIEQTGEVRFGFRTDAPPFSSLVNGQPAGFSLDLCALTARAIRETSVLTRLSAVFSPVGTGQRFEALTEGRIDVLCGATTATLTRRETVSFSLPVFLTGIGVLLRNDAPDLLREVLVEQSPAALSATVVETALRGLHFGVRSDTTAAAWFAESAFSGIEGVTMQGFDTHDSAVDALRSGRIDGYFADRAILVGLTMRETGEDASFQISKKTFTHEPYALAIPRGDDDFRLVVDRALSHLYRSGAVLELFERHFGQPTADVVLFYQRAALPE